MTLYEFLSLMTKETAEKILKNEEYIDESMLSFCNNNCPSVVKNELNCFFDKELTIEQKKEVCEIGGIDKCIAYLKVTYTPPFLTMIDKLKEEI